MKSSNQQAQLALAVLALGASGAVEAHTGLHAGGTLAAFTHAFTGVDHLLAMLAIGAWGASASRLAPVAFVAAALLGAIAGATGYALSSLETWLALSLVLAGAVIAARRAPALRWLLVAAAAMGVVHGNAHGLEVAGAGAVASLAAFGVGTASLHALGYATARGLATRAPRGLRAVGAAIALVGGWLALA